jgi:hypothetical protein
MARFWFLRPHPELDTISKYDTTPRTSAEAVLARANGRLLVYSSPRFRLWQQHTNSIDGAALTPAQQGSAGSSDVHVQSAQPGQEGILQHASLFDGISSGSDSEVLTVSAQQAIKDAEAAASKAWDLSSQLSDVQQQLSAVAAAASTLPTDVTQQQKQHGKAKHKQKQQRRNQKLKQQQLRDDELLQTLKQKHAQLKQQRQQQLPLQGACRQQLQLQFGTDSWQKEFFSSINHPPPPGSVSSCSHTSIKTLNGSGSDSSSTTAMQGDSDSNSSSGRCGGSNSAGCKAGTPASSAAQQQNSPGARAGSPSAAAVAASHSGVRGNNLARTYRTEVQEQQRQKERQQRRAAREARAAVEYDWGGCRPWHAQRAKQLTVRQQQLSRVAALQEQATSALGASHGLQRQLLGSADTQVNSHPADSASAAAAAEGQLPQKAEHAKPSAAGSSCEAAAAIGGSSCSSRIGSSSTQLQLQASTPHFRSISWQYAAQQKHRLEFGLHRSLYDLYPNSPPAAVNALDPIMHLRVQCTPASSKKQQQQQPPVDQVLTEVGQHIAAAEAEVQELCAGSKLLQELVSSRCRRHLADSSRFSKKNVCSTSSAGSAPCSLQAPGLSGLSGLSMWGEELVGSSAVQGQEGLQGEDESQGVVLDEAETQEDSLQGSDLEAGGSVSFGSSSAGSEYGCSPEREQQEGRDVPVTRTRQLLWNVMQQLKPAACHWYETGAAHHQIQQQKQQSTKQQQQAQQPGKGASSDSAVTAAVPKCSSQVLWRAITCSLASDLLLVPPSIRDLVGNGWAAGAGRLGAGRDAGSVAARMLLVQYARAARQQYAQVCHMLSLEEILPWSYAPSAHPDS